LNPNSYFKILSIIVIIAVFSLSVAVITAAAFFSTEVFRVIFIAAGILMSLFFLLLLTGFIFINAKLGREEGIIKTGNEGSYSFFMNVALKIFMPFLLCACNAFNLRKDEIRRIFITANNIYVLSTGKKVHPEKLLVLLPHCLQYSECDFRIKDGLNECRQCCRCTLGAIKNIVNRYGVGVALATGGTSARKTVKDMNPELVVAVACERDLASGIMDVRELPVYGIINKRPNGPCKDTVVDTTELEKAISYFTKELE